MNEKFKGVRKEMRDKVKDISDNSFEREVLQSEKLVLVDFWAEWCGPCRMLAPTVETIAEEYSDSVTVVKLNVDDNPSSAAAYGVRGIPTLLLFNEGKEVDRMIGAAGKEAISLMIEKHTGLPAKQLQLA